MAQPSDLTEIIKDYTRDYGRIYNSINWNDPKDVEKVAHIFTGKRKRLESHLREQETKLGVIDSFIKKIRDKQFPEINGGN